MCNEFVVCAFFLDFAVVQHQDPVAVLDGAEPVGDDEAGAVQAVQGFRNLFLGLVVQGGCGFVEDQDFRPGRDGPGDHDPLLLAAGDVAGAFGNLGLHAHGHFADVIGDAGKLRSLPGLVQGQLGRGDCDVGIDRPGEELAALHDDAEVLPKGMGINILYVIMIIENGSLLRGFKRQEQAHQRGFSAACAADNGHIFPGTDFHAQVVDDIGRILAVAEGKIVDFQSAGQFPDILLIG